MTRLPERAGPMVRNPKNIGGSDAAAIVGEDPNKTAYAVALRLRGEIQSDSLDELDHIQIGNLVEGGVLAPLYERKEKVKVYVPEPIVHPKYPFLSVNIDRIRDDRLDIGIEAKNTGQFTNEQWGEPGTDEVPKRVLLQCQHAMLVVPEIQEFHVLRLHGGNSYQKFVVPRSDALIESLLEIELEFYDKTMRGDLPTPDWGHRTTKDVIKRAFRKIQGEVVQAPPELEALTVAWQATSAQRLDAQKAEAALKNQIEFLCGNAGEVVLADGRRWRRKEVKRREYTVEATSYIETRLLKS